MGMVMEKMCVRFKEILWFELGQKCDMALIFVEPKLYILDIMNVRGYSSVGRASALHAEGLGFDSL